MVHPIAEATNEDKDEKAYGDNEEMEDVEREDESYGLLAAPCARSASHTDGRVLHRPTLRSRVGGVIVSMTP